MGDAGPMTAEYEQKHNSGGHASGSGIFFCEELGVRNIRSAGPVLLGRGMLAAREHLLFAFRAYAVRGSDIECFRKVFF